MKSALFLGFVLASASDVWVDDDLSLLQTRAVLQSGGDADACFQNVAYHSGPMVDGNANAENSADCNARCSENTDCAFWDLVGGTCRLRSSAGSNGAQSQGGASAGPRGCRFRPTTRSCEEINVAYHSGPMVNANAGGSSAADCKSRCSADARCFFWDFGENHCRLRSGEGGGSGAAPGYIAGARLCTEPPTTTTPTTTTMDPTHQQCTVEVETSDREHGGTSSGASAQFQVDGVWTAVRNFPENIAEGQLVIATKAVSARPSALRISAGGTNAWGYTHISVSCDGETIFVLEGDDSYSGNSQFWVDGNQEAPATQEYQIPSTNPLECVIEVVTGLREHSGTETGARAQLQVEGVWIAPRNFPLNIAEGELVATTEFVSVRPSALRIAAGGSNAWGYDSVSVICDGEQVLLMMDDEEDYGANVRFWVDGNQEAPETQDYAIDAATTPMPAPVPEPVPEPVPAPVQDEASAVGDPHLITSSRKSYDLEQHHLHHRR